MQSSPADDRAARGDDIHKRQRALTALTILEQQGKKITHTAVARAVGVSAWLACAGGICERIEGAQQRQHSTIPSPARARGTAAMLRTELELARQEIRILRVDRDRMRRAVQHQRGE